MFEFINEISKEYPIVGSTISLMTAGGAMYFLKDVPRTLYYKIKSQFFTTITISNEDWGIFSALKRFLADKEPFMNRHYKMGKLRRNGSGEYFISPTGSSFYVKIEGVWYKISYSASSLQAPIKENGDDGKIVFEKESYHITYLGRSLRPAEKIKGFLKKLEKTGENPTEIDLINIQNGYSYIKESIKKRSLDSIIVNKEILNKILSNIRFFLNEQDFYVKNGIPYRLNIVLYGPPGTGKSSLIKALASEFALPLYIMNPSKIMDSTQLLANKDRGIIAFEDVDSFYGFLIPKEEEPSLPTVKMSGESRYVRKRIAESAPSYGTSEVLNFFDGIASPEGFICILTTNHIEKINPAVIRPGRMHLKIEIPPIKAEDVPERLKPFLKKGEKKITGAELQERYMRHNMKGLK